MKIIISGRNFGMKKISLIQYLGAYCNMSLSEAHGAVDGILARRRITVVIASEDTLQDHLENMRALGTVARADDSE